MDKFKGVFLNKDLIDRNGLSLENQDIINRLHEIKHYLFEFMKSTDDTDKLKRYAGLVESVEFKLQQHWGFPLNRGFHDWFMVPKCECPKSDNSEYRGSNYRYINPNCKLHG